MKRAALALALLIIAGACSSSAGHESEATDDAVATAKNPAPSGIVDSRTNPHCGYERWAVKTGQDPLATSVDLTPKQTTIANLSLMRSPLPPAGRYPPQVKRQPSESQAYMITATVIAYRTEADSDLHLVVSDGAGHTMITEIPNPACMGASPWVAQVTAARDAFLAKTHYPAPTWTSRTQPPPFVKARIPVTLTGVAFFDFPHSQYGAAKANAVELHPIMAIAF